MVRLGQSSSEAYHYFCVHSGYAGVLTNNRATQKSAYAAIHQMACLGASAMPPIHTRNPRNTNKNMSSSLSAYVVKVKYDTSHLLPLAPVTPLKCTGTYHSIFILCRQGRHEKSRELYAQPAIVGWMSQRLYGADCSGVTYTSEHLSTRLLNYPVIARPGRLIGRMSRRRRRRVPTTSPASH